MKDKTVAILESRLGKQLVGLIAKRGGRPVHAPALAEVPEIDPAFITGLLKDLAAHPAKMAIFQTGVGTNALFNATDQLGLTDRLTGLLAKMTVVVRGPKPTGALRARGVRIDLSAAEPFTTTEILQALEGAPLTGEKVLVQRYGVANIELEETLKARGARVIEITTYRWALPADTRPLLDLIDELERGKIDSVAITNAAQVYNLFALAERSGRTMPLRKSLNRTLVASIGPVASEALKKFGVSVSLEASPPKLGPFIEALDVALSAAPPSPNGSK
jgi:uroporphyrinogen-III synthase